MVKPLNVPIGIVVFVEEEEEVSLDLNYRLEPGPARVNRGKTMCSVSMLREETTVSENLHDHPCDLVGPCWCGGTWASTRAASHAPRRPLHIGVLCVISHEPRTFSEAEAELLRFATVVMSLLDLHLPQQPTWNP